MRMDDSRESQNIEDRRAAGPRLGGKGRIGIGTIVLALVAMYFGIDPSVVLQMAEDAQAQAVDLDLQVDVVDPVHDFENPINVFVRQIGEFCFHHKHPCSLIGRRRIRRAWPGTA